MLNTYAELRFGGVLVAPFAGYAALALVLFVAVRYALLRISVDRFFNNLPVVEVSIYTLILAALIILF